MTIGNGGLNTTTSSPNLYYNPTNGQVSVNTGASSSNYWSLVGNSGTTPGTNFIGTTDNNGLIFKINNTISGWIGNTGDTTTMFGYNTGVGSVANISGSGNIMFGSKLWNGSRNASNNIGVGYNLFNGSSFAASNNISIGYNGANSLTSGANNIGMGYSNISSLTTGSNNIAIGYESLNSVSTGSYNVVLGGNAMGTSNAGTSNNIAIGYNALAVGGGGNNTAVGHNAWGGSGSQVVLGTNNVFLGAYTLQTTSGSYPVQSSNNTFLGAYTDYVTGTTNITNSTAIGFSAQVSTSNTIQLGNSSVTGLTIGNGGLQTSSNFANLYYNQSNGQLSVATSSLSSSNNFGQFYVNTALNQNLTMASWGGGAAYYYYFWALTGATSSGQLMRGFSGGTNGSITYTGSTGYFEIDYAATVTPSSTQSFYAGIAKNVTNTSPSGQPSMNFPASSTTAGWSATTWGTLALDSVQLWGGITGSNTPWPIAGNCVMQLNSGDTIQFVISMPTSSTIQATAKQLSIKARQI